MSIEKQANRLQKYLDAHLLEAEIDCEVLALGEKEYNIISDEELLFDEDFEFLPEFDDGAVYELGGRWYLQEEEGVGELTELKYVGKAVTKLPTKNFLGIRSGYELRNGIGLHSEYVKKGKYLGVEALGICERSTLSGVLLFQGMCQREGIKSVIGMTVPVLDEDLFDIKLYAKNFKGWSNLLKFSEVLNIEEKKAIDIEMFMDNLEGLIIVADPKSMDFNKMRPEFDYYQLDTVRFLNSSRDAEYINNLERFMRSDYSPISITDAFYLEKSEYVTREHLWAIAKSFDDKTDNQYFKSKDQYAKELIQMFDSSDKGWVSFFKEAVANEQALVDGCNFMYDTDTRHLPKYQMSKEESSQFETNEKLFMYLIKKGFKDRGVKSQKYIDRVKEEIRVLRKGDVIDYFLVLHDIIGFAKKEELLTGIGRGSAGGSLVSYLLGLIQIDPLEFDLLFERFLNDGRMGEYEDRPLYIIEGDGKKIELIEGTIVRILRDEEEENVFVNDLKEGDEILKY